ncbi:MAG: S41 family peptidase [Desulfovibrionaceae bacterium]|nr:S41 family peptidase [Desulfovibrionaceae bacterium]
MRYKLLALLALLLMLAVLVLFCGKPVTGWSGTVYYDYNHLKRFSEARELVQREYVREVTGDELMEGAIRGMLQSLDPHSSYLNAEELGEMRDTTSGEFSGIGVEISTENGKVTVITPIDDTPAQAAGIKAGDIILAVDGRPTMDMSQQEVVGSIRGPKGSKVELLILHKDGLTPVSMSIERGAIPVRSVRARYLEDGFLWVRLTRFSEKTTKELTDALADARKQTSIKGVILDVRNNPGGLLEQAVSVSDVFLQDGLIVSMKGRDSARQREFSATRNNKDVREPMVVLVNSGSASAAEIVAGALQDRKRAVLIGERTFGKGTVQEIRPLGDAAIKLTTAMYYTPSGRSIQAAGIEPDLIVPFETPRENAESGQRFQLREQDLSRHLENAGKSGDKNSGNAFKPDKEAVSMLERDNQLRMALQVVKSLPKIHELSWQQR